MSQILNNETKGEAPPKQRIIEKLGELPTEALEELDDFVTFLVARAQSGLYANLEQTAPSNQLCANEGFLKTLALLSPTDARLVDQLVFFQAGRSLKWSYDDPRSLSQAMDLMARDPCLRKEMGAINKEFMCSESDGLEPY
jgi:hypothetical protein